MALVVDACVIVEILTDGPRAEALLAALDRHEMLVPQLAVSETFSSLARIERSGQMTSSVATGAIANLESAPLNWVDDQGLVSKAWRYRAFLQATDALYVAAAEQCQVPLLTIDMRLARAVREQVPAVAVITP